MEVLAAAAGFLEKSGVENPRLHAELLFARVLGMRRIDLYLQFDKPVEQEERERYKELLRRHSGGEPLQYVIGYTEFMSLPFEVGPPVLIPRPETELLVETAIDFCKDRESMSVLDIGSGSGAIGVSVARYCPGSHVTCIDNSTDALRTARNNAQRNGVADRMSFANLDIAVAGLDGLDSAPFDCILSNPPYVTTKEWASLPAEIRDHEPRRALVGGEEGLDLYPHIIKKASAVLRRGGMLLVEVGRGQGGAVAELFAEGAFTRITVYPDLNGIPRAVRGIRHDGGVDNNPKTTGEGHE